MKPSLIKLTIVNCVSLAVALCIGWTLPASAGSVTVILKASDGVTGVPGATVSYYKSGKKFLGTTGDDGSVSAEINDVTTTTIYLEPASGGTRQWLLVKPADSPTLTAKMVAVTVKLETCTGSPLVGEAKYYRGGWPTIGNTPATIDLLPYTGLGPGQGSYDFQVKYDGRTSATIRQDIAVNPSVVFTTTKVTLAGGSIWYYNNGGWQSFVSPKEMLPATYNFKFDDIHNPTVTLDINGCEYPPPAPEIVLYDGISMVSEAELLDGQATPVDFCTVPLGSSAERQFTLFNEGNGVLNVVGVTFGGDNSGDFSASEVPALIQPGANATFTVTFHPTAVGNRSATLVICDDDANENPFEITVIGNAVSANTPPAVTCPAGVTLDCAPPTGLSAVVTATVTDPDSDQTLTVTLKQGDSTLDTQTVSTPADNTLATFIAVTLSPGTHPLTIEVSDGTARDSCETTVTVNEDETPPEITCPADITVSTDADKCTAKVTYSAPVGTDNCPGPATTQTAGLPSGAEFQVGTTVNTFKVTDAAGLTAECSFSVMVNDTTPPTISCVGPQTRNSGPGVSTYTTQGTEFDPTAFADNCSGATILNNYNGGDTLAGAAFPVGTTTVTWTVTDASGNASTCTETITVYSSNCGGSCAAACVNVEFVVHAVQDATPHPKVRKIPVSGATVRVYARNEYCTDHLIASGKPKIWGKIFDGFDPNSPDDPACPPLAECVTDANGRLTICVPTDIDLVVIGKLPESFVDRRTDDPLDFYCGAHKSRIKLDPKKPGACKDVKLDHVRLFSGKKVAARRLEYEGTYLGIIMPEDLEFDTDTQFYPIVLDADGTWAIETSLSLPEGFVTTTPVLGTIVADSTTAIQFDVTDVGSDWTAIQLTHKITHKGKAKIGHSSAPLVNKRPPKAHKAPKKGK